MKTFFDMYEECKRQEWNGCGVSVVDKDSFHKLGKKFLKTVAKQLSLPNFDVRSNKGGDAIVGEVILHTPSFYVNIGTNFSYARACQGMKDYSGGVNNTIPTEALKSVNDFIEFLQYRGFVFLMPE